MSNPPSPKDSRKTKGPNMRIESAGDIPEEQLKQIAQTFAEKNAIANYRLNITINESLIGGFIIYFLGMRYDYTIRGQLSRINSFMKSRADDEIVDSASFRKDVTESLREALDQFPETAAASLDSAELWGLNDEQFKARVEAAFNSLNTLDEVGSVVAVSDGVATVTGLSTVCSTSS